MHRESNHPIVPFRPALSCTIEHRAADGVHVVAVGTQPLAPIAAYLEAMGQDGDLLLIDEKGQTVIRWPLTPRADRFAGDCTSTA